MTKRKTTPSLTPEEAKFEARVEEEVRRRTLALLRNANLPESDVAREVHYWMPQEFMEWYRDLFLTAFKLEGRGHEALTRTNSRGEVVPVGDNRRLAPGKPRQRKRETDEAFAERTRGLHNLSSGGGKKYKEHYTIRDEETFRIKQLVDRRLMEFARGQGLRVREQRAEGRGSRLREQRVRRSS